MARKSLMCKVLRSPLAGFALAGNRLPPPISGVMCPQRAWPVFARANLSLLPQPRSCHFVISCRTTVFSFAARHAKTVPCDAASRPRSVARCLPKRLSVKVSTHGREARSRAGPLGVSQLR